VRIGSLIGIPLRSDFSFNAPFTPLDYRPEAGCDFSMGLLMTGGMLTPKKLAQALRRKIDELKRQVEQIPAIDKSPA
jgi:hypothetical protein